MKKYAQGGTPLTLAVKMWRTPDAHCGRGANSVKRMKMKLEKKMPISLNDQVAHPRLMWPTPRVNGEENLDTLIKRKGVQKAVQHNLKAAVQMWPTPTVNDSKNNGGPSQLRDREKKGKNLNAKAGGSLNPEWVEWLMGFPKGWTDLKPSETQ
jgi:hypothetical protein